LSAETAEGMTNPRNEESSTGWPPGVVRTKGFIERHLWWVKAGPNH